MELIDIRLAIHQNIRLILRTFPLRYRFDPTFGSVMNKFQGSSPPQGKKLVTWREEMRVDIEKNLSDILKRYETRLKIDRVSVNLQEPEDRESEPSMKVQVEIF